MSASPQLRGPPQRRPALALRAPAADWSDDDLEEINDIPVVPMPIPVSTVVNGGSSSSINNANGSVSYNERLARARNATMAQRRGSGGAQSGRPALADFLLRPLPPFAYSSSSTHAQA